MKKVVPRVSFAVPVRNGERYIGKLIQSILEQTFYNFEIVVCDNGSSDKTREVVQAFAERDDRIKCHFNETDIGQIENFNRVFHLSRGQYIRWIGADDWLEMTYTEKCVKLLDNEPTLIGVTTYTVLHYDDGREKRFEYEGERLESPDPSVRFTRLMWLLSKGLLYYSPLSALFRRDALEQTQLFQVTSDTDFVLVAELSVAGRFGHIPEHLVHRRRPADSPSDRDEMYKRYYPENSHKVRHSYRRSCQRIASMMLSNPSLGRAHKVACILALAKFYAKIFPREFARESKAAFIRALPREFKVVKALDQQKAGD